MLKASTWSSGAHHGILAALLAQEGYTGPRAAIETYIERVQVSHGFDALVPGEFTVLDHNMLKGFAAQVLAAGAIEAVLALAQEHGLSPEGIDEIVVHCFAELVRSSAGPGAYRPATREAADHSAPFLLALALSDGDVLPEHYRRKPWEEERLIALMGKISFEVDEQLDARALADGGFPVRVEIRARGQAFLAEREYPRGHAKNPMSSLEVRDKFRRLTRAYLAESRQLQIIEIADRLDEEDSLEPLMASLVF
jgi:2-methylcitrate dehydratase